MTPDKIVFSGVGKTRAELELGLDTGIAQFNIESREEGRELAELAAARGEKARCALREPPLRCPSLASLVPEDQSTNPKGVSVLVWRNPAPRR